MLNIILFGPPGSGKGTQATNIIEKYDLIHISTGDILRSAIQNGTPLGLEAKKFIDQGVLVPDEVVIGLISSTLDENPNAKGFIFDGFPRTIAQAEALDELLANKNTPLTTLLALQVEETELIQRMHKRGTTSNRTDDQDEGIIKNRIEEYKKKTFPVANHYDQQSKLININGMGTIEETFTNLVEELEKIT